MNNMYLAPSEKMMWADNRIDLPQMKDDREINERYDRGEGRVVIETNREKLPTFVVAMKNPNYLDVRPFYQRRPRWTAEKQSRLIESFIMNIPVPPIFLYEKEYNSYEVMDGQQRITAIHDFYENKLKLTGLQMWPELNGRYFRTLPEKIRAGVDRRSITSIVLLKESTQDETEAGLLRETVFERLNTGGVHLEHQEIRNALYQSDFNDLLFELSRLDLFRSIWGLPPFTERELETNEGLLENSLFSKMGDLEIILRFFALRHVEHYTRGMHGFLDLYMMKAARFSLEDVAVLRSLFITTLNAVVGIFGEKAFRPFSKETNSWEERPHRAFYDAVMVGVSNHLDRMVEFPKYANEIVESTKALFIEHAKGTFTGRGNSKRDVQQRIDLFSQMLSATIK